MDERLMRDQQKIEQALSELSPTDDPEEWRRRGEAYKQHAAELERFLLMRRMQERGLKLVKPEEQETGPAEGTGPEEAA